MQGSDDGLRAVPFLSVGLSLCRHQPKTYREAIQRAIRHFIETRRQLPTAVVVNPGQLDEARQAMKVIAADLGQAKARLTGKGIQVPDGEIHIPVEAVGGFFRWEIGLPTPARSGRESDGRQEGDADGDLL